jgi:hypothetical protein
VLVDVSASSTTDAWAVGAQGRRTWLTSRTLAERWDGVKWQQVATPNPGQRRDRIDKLDAVVAIASNDAWAVGEYGIGSAPPLLLHWNGSKWLRQIVPSAARHATFYDLAAVSPSDVWAVGVSRLGLARTMHYNGSGWRVVPAVNPGPSASLSGVAATSSSDVWAVGDQHGTLVEHWDGTAWHLVTPSRKSARELGVATTSPTDAWGVGLTKSLDSGIDHWDGHAWKVVFRTPRGPLLAVAASGPTDVWAVGSGRDQTSGRPAAAHWNGTVWSESRIATPAPASLYSIVNVSSTRTYWAVGGARALSGAPLIESRC